MRARFWINFPNQILILVMRIVLLFLVFLSITHAEEKTKVLLVGDSTTIGGTPRKLNPDAPQLEGMIEILAKAQGLPPLEVINTGVGGETAKRLLGSKNYQQKIKPLTDLDYIIVRLGINDWFRYEDFPKDFPIFMKSLLADLRKDHPKAKIILATICSFMPHEDCLQVNALIKELATAEKLPLLDIYTPYHQYLTDNGPNSLNVRRIPLRLIPEPYHDFLKPHTSFQKGWNGKPDENMVRLDHTTLDPIFGHIEGWYGDRHPNTEGYHLIARETVKFLKVIITK